MTIQELDSLLREASGPPSEPGRRGALERPTVLVVDDDEGMRTSLDFLLSSRYRVILCASAQEGVQSFSASVCAVILDVKMRGHDGFWACEQLRKIEPEIPIIFYSAYQDVKDPYDIINTYRPFGYITKDGDPGRLLDTLTTATSLFQTTLRVRHILDGLRHRRGASS